MTGVLSATDVYVSALAVGTNDLLGKDIHIEKAAVADIQALTDGTNITVDFNVGQNFTVTLAGNRTLDLILIIVLQDRLVVYLLYRMVQDQEHLPMELLGIFLLEKHLCFPQMQQQLTGLII